MRAPDTPRPSVIGSVRKVLPYRYLLPLALLLALAPLRSQPHLIEKLGMLFDGTLTRPIDIFDLVLHGGPLGLLMARIGIDVLATVGGRGTGAA